jgi:hypothetical protein
MAARISDDFLESEKKEPVSRKKDKADVFFIGEDEIGLLDIVLMDAISTNDGAVDR